MGNQPDYLSRRRLLTHAGAASALMLKETLLPGEIFGWAEDQREVRFKKTVLDSRFVAESVAVADVNRDGKLDILVGNVWYEAPHWTPYEIAPFQFVDPATGYSNAFLSWAEDFNHDGWVDQLVVGMPGEKVVWRENPKGLNQPWKEHLVWRSACDETPHYVDLFKNGKRVLVMGTDDDYVGWFEPATDPYAEWNFHRVSEKKEPGSQRYWHGLGVGDINADGRNEIITNEGYYVAPANPRSEPWTFVKADLGPPCAHMPVLDINGDHLPDVISSSAHDRGVWWHEQLANGAGFRSHLIDDTISQTHSLVLGHFGRRKQLNIVTGKRFWAHGPNKDLGANEPALLVRYEMSRTKKGVEWVRTVIDEDSGVGTHFVVQDVNHDGREDIVIANKKGVFLFEQI